MSLNKISIAVDAMGGDKGPCVSVPATIKALSKNSNLEVILVGDQQLIETEIKKHSVGKGIAERMLLEHAPEVVGMDDSPAYALRNKKKSSMRIALNMVKENKAKACVSAGNTGALMATARYVLKMLPGIDRPAIMFPLPSITGPVYVLDLGANVDSSAQHLFQFAIMGSVAVEEINSSKPKVGMLNVGSEDIKGTEQVKQAGNYLSSAKGVNYIGFVEGDDIYKGTADVVVCDGFAGNVALKSSEGLAQMMLFFARKEFTKNIYTKFAALMAKPVLKSLMARFNPSNYNGGSLLGLQGVVIKSHGNACQKSFATAIEVALKEAHNQVPTKIKNSLDLKLEGCEMA